jgi:tetratricopeptide (TPR) repeat protein
MTVRRLPFALLGLSLVLLCAGCGGGDPVAMTAETDDSAYRQGKQLEKEGRNPEALAYFLKVIETRGERSAAESHLEAGLIYLEDIKNPIEAIHHFNKYLELQPNSREAPGVRERINTAKREFAKTIPGRPEESQSVRMEASEELDRLRRENQEMSAELATLRGGASRLARPTQLINLDVEKPRMASGPNTNASPIPVAPPPRSVATEQPLLQPVSAPPPRTAAAPPKQSAAKGSATKAPASGGRTHTVAQSESLWKIARQHYGSGATAAQVRGIFEANRGVMRDETDLKVGMVLRIP